MKESKNISGGLDLDSNRSLVGQGDYWWMRNGITQGGEGKDGTVYGLEGNELVTLSGLDGNHTLIAVHESRSDRALFLFYYNSADPNLHKIIKVDSSETVTNVITSSVLAFTSTMRINNVFTLNGEIYYCDGGDPKAISLTRWVSDTTGISTQDILLIKASPQLPTLHGKFVNEATGFTVPSNLIDNEDFQFAYQYLYEGNKASVLSPISELVRRNIKHSNSPQGYRRIRVYIPIPSSSVDTKFPVAGETQSGYDDFSGFLVASTVINVPVTVKTINVFYRKGNLGVFTIADRIDRNETTGLFPRNWVDFYNNVSGGTLDTRYLNSHDFVPHEVDTMELISNRIFCGRYQLGYDKSDPISLTASPTTVVIGGSKTTFDTQIFEVIQKEYQWDAPSGKWLATGTESYTGTYVVFYNGEARITGAIGTGIAYDPATYLDSHEIGMTASVFSNILNFPDPPTEYATVNVFRTIGLAPNYYNHPSDATVIISEGTTYTSYLGLSTFGSNSRYKLGIIFSDGEGRKNSLWTDSSLEVSFPESQFVTYGAIDWAIGNDLNIPSWADYYSIVMTEDLKKTFKINYNTTKLRYVQYDENGDRQEAEAYSSDTQYLMIDIRGMLNVGMGYTFNEGDRIVIYGVELNGSGDGYIDRPIKAMDGGRVLIEPLDVGTLTSGTNNAGDFPYKFEIYTPRLEAVDSLYYHIGQTFKIDRTGSTQFSVKSGTITGDTVTIEKARFFWDETGQQIIESGDDLYHSMHGADNDPLAYWNTNRGRAYVESETGAVRRYNHVRWGSEFVDDVGFNKIHEFSPVDERILAIEAGELQKLIRASRDQKTGTILLGLCEVSPVSIYVQEATMTTADDTSFLLSSGDVIGQVRELMGGFGTTHPESVIAVEGQVYYWSDATSKFCRYSSNGVHPISEYKARKYFIRQNQLNDSSDRVITGFDPYNRLLLVSFSNADSSTEKTISFAIDENRWKTFNDFAPLFFGVLNDRLHSMTSTSLYSHDSATVSNYGGIQYNVEVGMTFNETPLVVKEWNVLMIHPDANAISWTAPEAVIADADLRADISNNFGQATDIESGEFDIDEDVIYGAIRQDLNSGVADPILNGDDIVSSTLDVKITFKHPQLLNLRFFEIIYEESRGHRV